uniref:GG12473 n=2 Tax=Drosophila erecta TaxID=7220 RepID=B3P8H6_DROER
MALAKTSSGKSKCGKQISRQLGAVLVDQSPREISRKSHEEEEGEEAALPRCTLIKVQHQEAAVEHFSGAGHNNMLVKPKLKLSKKSWRITGPDQDGLRCDEVATINNGGQVQQQQQQQQLGQEKSASGESEYQNYHCPTGKSCSNHSYQLGQPVANKLSTVAMQDAAVEDSGGAALSAGSHKQAPAARVNQVLPLEAAGSIGRREWQLLRHLSGDHRLAVLQIYGTFGERLHVRPQLPPEGVACLRLSEESATFGHVMVHTFFLAVIAIGGGDGHAVFLWHLDQLDHLPQGATFETVIETQGHRFVGAAHSLRRSWPEIRASGQFLTCRNLADKCEVTIRSR